MAEPGTFAHRVFVQDLRSDGKFLRVTWHPELQAFVVSNWDGDVCVGATRMAVDDAPRLISLLSNGMADALATERAVVQAGRTAASKVDERGMRSQIERVRSRLRRLVRDVRRVPAHEPLADVVELSRHRGHDDESPRWASPDRP